MKLLSVEEARGRMLAAARPLPDEAVPLAQAVGRILARDVVASRDQPPFRASAMDGWAIRAADGAGPRRIVGESAAGHGYEGTLGPGEAVRIFTGAAVPPGADKIVIQEEARREGDQVVFDRVDCGDLIRRPAIDFAAGARLLAAGTPLDPWRMTLAAAAGVAAVQVAARPRLALLSTGEEVVPPGGSPGPFQIFELRNHVAGDARERLGRRRLAAGHSRGRRCGHRRGRGRGRRRSRGDPWRRLGG